MSSLRAIKRPVDSEEVLTITVEATAVAAATATGAEASLNPQRQGRESGRRRQEVRSCEGSHKSDNCPGRLDSEAAPAADDSMHGGYISVIHSYLDI